VTTYIAFLRGINVGGRTKIPMAQLRRIFAEKKLGNPRTVLQSGNAVFTSSAINAAALGVRLEAEIEKRFGLRPDVVLRTLRELDDAITNNPFPKEAKSDPGHLLFIFPKTRVSSGAATALKAAIKGRERAVGKGLTVYVYYPDGIGTSKLTPAVIEKALGVRATGRNWNTVLKVSALAKA